MTKMNMAIRGIDANFGLYQADTFINNWRKTLKADFILANPPFNYHPWNQERLVDDSRWKYGLPPTGNANYTWIQHMLHYLASKGKTLFINARNMGHMVDRKHRVLDDEKDIKLLADTFEAFQNGTLAEKKSFMNLRILILKRVLQKALL